MQIPLTAPSMPRRRWSHGEVSMQRWMSLRMPPLGRIVLARQYDVKAPGLIGAHSVCINSCSHFL